MMRRSLLFAVLSTVTLVGCADEEPPTLVFSSAPAEVEVGETMQISLSENPSIGDAWQVSVPPDEEVVRIVDDFYRTDDPELVGAGGERAFELEAVGPGKTSVVIHNCFRCDDDGNTPADVADEAVDLTYEITVR